MFSPVDRSITNTASNMSNTLWTFNSQGYLYQSPLNSLSWNISVPNTQHPFKSIWSPNVGGCYTLRELLSPRLSHSWWDQIIWQKNFDISRKSPLLVGESHHQTPISPLLSADNKHITCPIRCPTTSIHIPHLNQSWLVQTPKKPYIIPMVYITFQTPIYIPSNPHKCYKSPMDHIYIYIPLIKTMCIYIYIYIYRSHLTRARDNDIDSKWQAFASLICHALGPLRPLVRVKAYTHLSSEWTSYIYIYTLGIQSSRTFWKEVGLGYHLL